MEITGIKRMIEEGVALGPEQRDFLIDGIFRTKLKDDDPKYDDWNNDWLDGLSDEELLNQYEEFA